MSEPLGEIGRFAEPSLFILASLSEGPKHGYAIRPTSRDLGQPSVPHALRGARPPRARGLIEASSR